MADLLQRFTSLFPKKASPTKTLGTHGTVIIDGYVESDEKNPDLASHDRRYQTYSNLLANTSIVATGVRYFLNLAANAEWAFTPSDNDTGGEYAERIEQMLTDDPDTSWQRIVRRAAMYRFYGFAIQEWTAKRSKEGFLTLKDVAPRAQSSITRWNVDPTGALLGAVQTSPIKEQEIYLPRKKFLYMVDDSLNDSPEGLGIFRHLVPAAKRLERYEQLEGFGFEMDLGGIPVIRAPFTQLAEMVASGQLSEAQRKQLEAPLRTFAKNHIRNPQMSLMLDSMTYETSDESARPSNIRQWDVELMKGESTSFAANAAAIERLNREMARLLGIEQMLLGSDSSGSFALSQDKTNAFYLLVDSALTEIAQQVQKDLVDTLFRLNGWPEEMKPTLTTEAVRFKDAESIAIALRDMASAGAVLAPDDPAIGEVRDLIGLSRPDENQMTSAIDASLTPGNEGKPPVEGQEPDVEEDAEDNS